MILHKFVQSLSNAEKAELLKAIADTCYAEKGAVLDYLHDLAGFIAQEPEKKIARKNAVAIQPVNLEARGEPMVLTDDEKRALIAGNKIGVIKSLRDRYRDSYGNYYGLKEVKDFVDNYDRTQL